MLTAERLKEIVSYDPETGKFTRLHPVKGARVVAGNLRLDGYLSIYIDGKARSAHRMAWLYVHGRMPAEQLDHINGDRTDNRIVNLREVSKGQNAQNIGKAYANNKSSGVLGVYRHVCGKWQAKIQVNGKSRSLGLFESIDAARVAYLAAKDEVHPFSARV